VTSWSRPWSNFISGSRATLASSLGNNLDSQEMINFFIAAVSSPRTPSAPFRSSSISLVLSPTVFDQTHSSVELLKLMSLQLVDPHSYHGDIADELLVHSIGAILTLQVKNVNGDIVMSSEIEVRTIVHDEIYIQHHCLVPPILPT
jgi:hypothetical protein